MERRIDGGAFLAMALLMSFAIGCNSQTSNNPKTYPVTGTVTHNGTPLADATVTFVSPDGKSNAIGTTDASGKYAMTTFVKDDGALPGQYQVRIVKYEKVEATGSTSEADYVPPSGDAAVTAPKNLLPAKYASEGTSGLTATVGEKAETVDFALTD